MFIGVVQIDDYEPSREILCLHSCLEDEKAGLFKRLHKSCFEVLQLKRLLSFLSFLVLTSLMINTVEATVYQGTATHSIAIPTLTLTVAIDTDAKIWTAYWEGKWYLLTPPSLFYSFAIVFQDSKGFCEGFSSIMDNISHKGVVTIEGYNNTGCWTHCWCRWTYAFPVPCGIGFIQCDLWVDLYLGSLTYGASGGKWFGAVCMAY